MDSKIFNETSAAVKQVTDRFGINILTDHKRFCSALSDFAPKLSKENKAFFVALSENIGDIFIRENDAVRSGSKDANAVIQRAVADICEYLNDEKSQLVVNSIAAALGWIKVDALEENKQHDAPVTYSGSSSSLIEDLFRKAQNGDNDACFNLGECFFYGRGVKQDYAKAVKWYIMSSDRGDCSSQKKLADCYYLGQGTEKNVAKAAQRYEQAAEQGDYDSQKALIRCYLKGGNGLFADPARAEFYSRRYNIPVGKDTADDLILNAQNGDPAAQYKLGNMYLNGAGVEHSPQKAISLFKKAASQNHAAAAYNLGYCYQHGIGVPVDMIAAVIFYKKAAENGDLDAMNNLAGCCMRGDGTSRDQNTAAKYYKKAAEKGHAKAQYNYGECCFKGMGTPKDPAAAANWYKLSAEQGDADGQYSYGWCLRDGIGTKQDSTAAKDMFELAAAQRHTPSQKALGYCYVNGTGVAQNFTVAAEQFAKAASNGDKEAAQLLVACYKYGGEYLIANDAKAHYYADQYDIEYDDV